MSTTIGKCVSMLELVNEHKAQLRLHMDVFGV